MTNKTLISILTYSCIFASLPLTARHRLTFDDMWRDAFEDLPTTTLFSAHSSTGGLIVVQDEHTPQVVITPKDDSLVIALDLKDKTLTDKDVTINPKAAAKTEEKEAKEQPGITLKSSTEHISVIAITEKEESTSKATLDIKNFDSGCVVSFATASSHKDEKNEGSKSSSAIQTFMHKLDFEQTEAEFKQGVLTLIIPHVADEEKTFDLKLKK